MKLGIVDIGQSLQSFYQMLSVCKILRCSLIKSFYNSTSSPDFCGRTMPTKSPEDRQWILLSISLVVTSRFALLS
jgi:hypothetical protein